MQTRERAGIAMKHIRVQVERDALRKHLSGGRTFDEQSRAPVRQQSDRADRAGHGILQGRNPCVLWASEPELLRPDLEHTVLTGADGPVDASRQIRAQNGPHGALELAHGSHEGRRLHQLEAAHFSDLERLTLKHANALPWDPEIPVM